MFIYYLVASWFVTILWCVLVKRLVANYEERQIASGECASPVIARGASTSRTVSYADSSITDRELAALKKMPVFQLWAESKSRSLTRLQLGQAQKRFWIKSIAYVALILAVTVFPFDTTLTQGMRWVVATNRTQTASYRTLVDLSKTYDRFTYMPTMLADVLELIPAQIGRMGPHQLAWGVVAPALMLIGSTLLLFSDWQIIKKLVKGSNSLIGFMATTDHDPTELALRMNKNALGDTEDYNDNRQQQQKLARALLVCGLLSVRFGHVAVSAFLHQSHHRHNAEPVHSLSVGFIVAATSALVLVCA